MIEILDRPHARIWFDEHPSIRFEALRVMTTALTAGQGIRTERRAGVEVFVATRHASNYALICGDFVANDLGYCKLRVPVSNDQGELLSWSLAAKYEDVRAGLLEDYAQYTLKAAPKAVALLGSGTLTLSPAAHASAGSSQMIFLHATSALIEIMALSPEDVTRETLREIIRRTGSTQRGSEGL